MNDEKKYETGLNEENIDLICIKCNEKLVLSKVEVSYLGNGFPVELPCCPKCGMVFVPEELAIGKMLHVEKSLEDK